MARKSAQELAEARRKKKAQQEEEERQSQIEHERQLAVFEQSRKAYLANKERYNLIKSDLDGWYEEFDKLTKKSPVDQITDLQLETVNDIIEQVKGLIKEDEFVNKVKLFVSAGDKPEYRDVIGVLRRLQQGLSRYTSKLDQEASLLRTTGKQLLGRDIYDLKDINLKKEIDPEDLIDTSFLNSL